MPSRKPSRRPTASRYKTSYSRKRPQAVSPFGRGSGGYMGGFGSGGIW